MFVAAALGFVLAAGCSGQSTAFDPGSLDGGNSDLDGGVKKGPPGHGSDGGGDTTDGAVPIDASNPDGAAATADACRTYNKKICTKISQCDPIGFGINFGDEATCEARMGIGCEAQFSLPGTGFTVANLLSCANATEAATCEKTILSNVPIPECAPAIGTLPNGAKCGRDDQCQSGACTSADSSCGTCVTPVGSGANCGPGIRCKVTDGCTNGKCNPWGQLDAPCDGNHPCDGAYWCNANNRCAALIPDNGGCTASLQCTVADDCGNTGGGTCQHNSLVASGQCGENQANQTSIFCIRGDCTAGGQPSGTCIPFSADGASCNPSTHNLCQRPATCVGGKCTILDPATCK